MPANLRGKDKRDDVVHREEEVVQREYRMKTVAATLQAIVERHENETDIRNVRGVDEERVEREQQSTHGLQPTVEECDDEEEL